MLHELGDEGSTRGNRHISVPGYFLYIASGQCQDPLGHASAPAEMLEKVAGGVGLAQQRRPSAMLMRSHTYCNMQSKYCANTKMGAFEAPILS